MKDYTKVDKPGTPKATQIVAFLSETIRSESEISGLHRIQPDFDSVLRDQKVAGSNPVTSTKNQPVKAGFFVLSAQKQWIIPDFADFLEKRIAKDFVGLFRILIRFPVARRMTRKWAVMNGCQRSGQAVFRQEQPYQERVLPVHSCRFLTVSR